MQSSVSSAAWGGDIAPPLMVPVRSSVGAGISDVTVVVSEENVSSSSNSNELLDGAQRRQAHVVAVCCIWSVSLSDRAKRKLMYDVRGGIWKVGNIFQSRYSSIK